MSVKADLDALKAMVGSRSTTDDRVLSQCLEASGSYIYDRVYSTSITAPEVVQAVLLQAARLYKRRLSPEGVAGWDDLGAIRVMTRDPDVDRLIEQHLDASKVWGIG